MNNLKIDDFMLLISTTDQLTEQTFLEDLFQSKNQILESNEITISTDCVIQVHIFKLDKLETGNKYYNANIKLITIKEPKQIDSNLIDQTQALTILFDIKQNDCLEKIEALYSKFNDDILQDKVLICKSNNDPDIENSQILNWCCKNGFEMVDLSEVKNASESEIKMLDNIAMKRFVEILDTHSWSTIIFKDEQDQTPLDQINSTSDLRSENEQDNLVDSYFKKLSFNENGKNTDDVDEKKPTFEELFGQIREFKEKADQLTGDEKYNYAEKVALAFLDSLDEDD